MPIKWSSKFEIKPGRWAFVPTTETAAEGRKIKEDVGAKWRPPPFFYHLQPGGHVAALRAHLTNSHFVRADIQDFFGSINRTRITRCLKPLFGYEKARQWANASTVVDPADRTRNYLPYGFVQSQILASLCLADSALGHWLRIASRRKNVQVSVYVDDIILSTTDPELSESLYLKLQTAAARSRLLLNPEKGHGPRTHTTAFNIDIAAGSIHIATERYEAFRRVLGEATSAVQRNGIVGYIRSVNADQASAL